MHAQTSHTRHQKVADIPQSPSQNVISAATQLAVELEAGRPLNARILRSAMEEAFKSSDTNGAWIWKHAYEAAEIAQIMMMQRYGVAMRKASASPRVFLTMIEKLAGLVPSQTRRSDCPPNPILTFPNSW